MPGETLAGFEVEAEIGRGGMATVYRAVAGPEAKEARPGERVALKVIHPHLVEERRVLDRFLLEAEWGQGIRHPNVVRTLGAGVAQASGAACHFLVMEYVEGQTLRQLLEESGRVSERLCRHIGIEVSRALEAIHGQGLIHRDVKAENVLILEDETVKVMDLGVARLKSETLRLSLTGQFHGTLMNAAPEQIQDAPRVDHRVDLYALGLLLYELITGENPFRAEHYQQIIRLQLEEMPRRPSILNPQISPFLEEVILKLLAKSREDRFARADELTRVLEQAEDSTWWRARSEEIRFQTRRPPRPMQIPRTTALFGREGSLAELERRWELAKAGQGQVVLVEGEAGIGKTRLVDDFASLLMQRDEDVSFAFGAYPPGGAAHWSRAIAKAFRDHLGDIRLESRLKELLPEVPDLVGRFAAFLREVPPPGESWFDRDAVLSLFIRLARALAATRPLLLLVDDLHFAPQEGQALFAALAHALSDASVLLVGTARPVLGADYVALLTQLPNVTRLSLDRLSRDDVRRIVSAALGSETLGQELADLVRECSDGIPYFVLEYIAELKQHGGLEARPEGVVLESTLRSLPRPRSLQELQRARLVALGPSERELLEVASCCGYEFDPTLVADVLGLGRIPALKALGKIERGFRIVRSFGRNFRFDHQQVHQTLYEEIPAPLREEVHAALGRLLAAEGEADGEKACAICFHLLRGARGVECRPWLRPAMDYLRGGLLNHRACELSRMALEAEDALDGLERAEMLLAYARLQSVVGSRGDLESTLREAQRLFEAAGELSLETQARQELARCLWEGGAPEAALDLLVTGVERAVEDGDRAREGTLRGALGNVLAQLGRYDEAEATFHRRLELARESGDRCGEAGAVGSLGLTELERGHTEKAVEWLARAGKLFREAGEIRGESISALNLGLAQLDLGLFEAAKASLQDSLALARRIGFRRGEANALGNLGLVHQAEGDFAAALEHFRRDVRIQREVGDRWHEGTARELLGRLCVFLGRLIEAREHFEWALETFDRLRFAWGRVNILQLLAELAHEEGDREGAARGLLAAEALAREIGKESTLGEVLLSLGFFEIDAGRHEKAGERFAEAVEMAKRNGARDMILLAEAGRAAVSGDASEARRLLAVERDRLRAETLLRAQYRLWRAEGRSEDIVAAHRLLLRIADRVPPEVRESFLEGYSVHREIRDAFRRLPKPPSESVA